MRKVEEDLKTDSGPERPRAGTAGGWINTVQGKLRLCSPHSDMKAVTRKPRDRMLEQVIDDMARARRHQCGWTQEANTTDAYGRLSRERQMTTIESTQGWTRVNIEYRSLETGNTGHVRKV